MRGGTDEVEPQLLPRVSRPPRREGTQVENPRENKADKSLLDGEAERSEWHSGRRRVSLSNSRGRVSKFNF